jgi:ABC-type dipeptide/oligopeptide/nickel transport system permease component
MGLVRVKPIQRLGRALLVGFGVMVVAFGLIHFIPGDPVILMLGDLATEDLIKQFHAQLGLDRSLPDQFVFYVGHVARGDLGTSIINGQPVLGFIELSLPVTLSLLGVSFALALVISIPLGVVAAIYRRAWFGQVFRVVTSISISTPSFFAGLIGILLFAIALKIAPVAGYTYDFPANLGYLWLPALINCGIIVPVLSRVLQSSIVDTLEQEFVETAIIRGLPRSVIVWRHLLRPSIAPTVSLMGYMIGQGLGASVVTEIVFNLPGIGTTLINAVTRRDYPMIQGIVLVFGMIVVIVSYLSDVASAWIDPRTKAS